MFAKLIRDYSDVINKHFIVSNDNARKAFICGATCATIKQCNSYNDIIIIEDMQGAVLSQLGVIDD